MRKHAAVVVGVSSMVWVGCVEAASAQDGSHLAGAITPVFQRAKVCADQMKSIGFKVDEVRTELDLTPKIEIFFRDVSDGASPSDTSGITKDCDRVARFLLTTRRWHYAGFRLTGVKIDFPGLRAVLIHGAAP